MSLEGSAIFSILLVWGGMSDRYDFVWAYPVPFRCHVFLVGVNSQVFFTDVDIVCMHAGSKFFFGTIHVYIIYIWREPVDCF